MPQLVPVIMNGLADVDWAPLKLTERWIVLSGEASDDDVARAIAGIATYSSEIGVRATIAETSAAIVNAKGFVVGGGLLFRDGDFAVEPGCCCGLEGWRDWYAVKKDGQSPWMGHDPMAWIDCTGDTAIVWSDEIDARSATVSYEALREALDVAARDIAAFVERLRAWGKANGAHPKLPDVFARVFDV